MLYFLKDSEIFNSFVKKAELGFEFIVTPYKFISLIDYDNTFYTNYCS